MEVLRALVSISLKLRTILVTDTLADYLFHQFGSNEDWDRLANVTGNANYTWVNMRQYIQKVEFLMPIMFVLNAEVYI